MFPDRTTHQDSEQFRNFQELSGQVPKIAFFFVSLFVIPKNIPLDSFRLKEQLWPLFVKDMRVSWNRGTPKSSICRWIFPPKPTIFGYPHFRNSPYMFQVLGPPPHPWSCGVVVIHCHDTLVQPPLPPCGVVGGGTIPLQGGLANLGPGSYISHINPIYPTLYPIYIPYNRCLLKIYIYIYS